MQAPRLQRQRSYEALSVASLEHSLGSDSEGEEEAKELPESYEDYMADEANQQKDWYNVRVDTNVVLSLIHI